MGKRANNEGTIFYRGDRRRWVAQASLSGRRLTKYFKTQRECRDWVRETMAKISGGLTFEGTKVTLERFTEGWLAGKKMAHRARTYEQYCQITKMHILPVLGKMKMQDLQPAQLKQLYMLKQEEGRGARTVQLIHQVMHGILEQAMKEGIISRNPADAVERPNVTQKEIKVFNEEQTRRLIVAGNGTRLGMLIYLALMTSLRVGELLGLKWEDVDWQKGLLDVRRQLQTQKGKGLVLVPPKTKAGIRKINLGQATLETLATHREKQDLSRAAAGKDWKENDLIFPNLHGNPWAETKILMEFKELLREAGLPIIRFHDLRHTSITLQLNNGIPTNTVQKRAGHSKASITTDIYGHSLARSEKEAAVMLEELLTPVAVKLLSK